MSKIETQLEINGVTYSGKDLDLICLGMSLKEESIINLLDEFIENSDLPEVVDRLEWLKDSIKGEK